MQISLSNVTYAYPASLEPVLRSVSITFPEGWTGVLGDNGCGKTTLAKIACGMIEPDSGTVARTGFAAFCAQEADVEPEALLDFASDFGHEARLIRSALRIEDDMPWRFDRLSFGERKKLQIAVALWRRPDVLVLDEPTNHIDHDAREHLSDALSRYSGVGILVSHDRELLDALADQCVSFEAEGVVVRPGGFSAARDQATIERTATMRERKTAKRDLARLSSEKGNRAREAARSKARASKRGISAKDHDAKDKIDRARVSGQDGSRGRLSAQMDARLDTARSRVEEAFVAKRYDGDLRIDASPSERKVLLRIEPTVIPCGTSVLSVPRLYVESADHIGIVGPNGAGKTTLVRHLLALLAKDVRALVVPQEPDEAERAAVLERAAALSDADRGRVLSTVAQLNSNPRRILEGDGASPGELRKLMLAIGMLEAPQVIVMDEPTNHLDLHSVEALERALASYRGALLLVSHDRPFFAACTSRTWTVRDGAVHDDGPALPDPDRVPPSR